MSSRWNAVVVNSGDPGRLGRWWAEVLGLRVLTDDGSIVVVGAPAGAPPLLHFVRKVSATNGHHNANGDALDRLRLDLSPDDLDGEVERLVNMGARLVDNGQSESGEVVLADPEGNVFRMTSPAVSG